MHKNVQVFEIEVEVFMNHINLFCITEHHWLRKYQSMFINLNNHQLARSFSREKGVHGGSLILIRNNLKIKEPTDIVSFSFEQTIKMGYFYSTLNRSEESKELEWL